MFHVVLLTPRLIGQAHHNAGAELALEDGIARRLVEAGDARYIDRPTATPALVETATSKPAPRVGSILTGKAH